MAETKFIDNINLNPWKKVRSSALGVSIPCLHVLLMQCGCQIMIYPWYIQGIKFISLLYCTLWNNNLSDFQNWSRSVQSHSSNLFIIPEFPWQFFLIAKNFLHMDLARSRPLVSGFQTKICLRPWLVELSPISANNKYDTCNIGLSCTLQNLQ